jgi:hypothetical protein
MTKFRLAAAAVMTFCALLLVGGAGTAAAQAPATSTSLTEPIAVTGTAKNGKKFNGSYRVKRFVAEGGKVLAVGTLKGTFRGRDVRRTGVKVPVSGTTFGGAGLAQSSQAVCQVLDLTLGPLDLSLLGLIVHLDEVHLDIDADPAGGLLGQLLCGLAGGVPPTPAPGVGQVVAILNSILALLQGLLSP